MATQISDGRGLWIAGGSEYIVGVTQDNKLMVDASVSLGSISVAAGSQSYIFGKSGADYYPLLSTSGTDGGLLRVDSSVSVSTGSNVWVKGGSIQTYNPVGIGSIWFGGGIGSVTITNALATIGSYTTQIISGTITIDNRVAGSIVNMPIVGISGTVVGVSGIVNQGTNPWVVVGSVAVTSSINVSTGSESYIKGGSIQTYNPIGVGSVYVSNTVTSSIYGSSGADIGIYPLAVTSGTNGILRVNVASTSTSLTITGGSTYLVSTPGSIGTYSASTLAVSGIVNQGTNPWIVLGSVVVSSPISVSVGSESYIKGGSIQTYNPVGVGSVTIVNARYDLGSFLVIAGSISSMPSVSVTAGSNVWVKGGSILTYSGTNYSNVIQETNPWIVLGSVAISSPISVATGSESYIKGGSIQTYSPLGVGSVLVISSAGSIGVYGSLSATAGSEQYIKAGSIQILSSPGSVGVYSASSLAISGIVNQGTSPWIVLGSVAITSPISVSTGSESYIKGGSISVYNLVGGSIVNWPGSLAISNFAALGSSIVITNFGALGSQVTIAAGSIRLISTTGSIGIYSSSSLAISGIVNQGTSPWVVSGTSTIAGSTFVTGSVNIATALLPISGLTRTIPTVINGSVLVASGTVLGLGSTILPSLLNTINWIAIRVSGNAPGSVYTFGVKDSEGYLLQSQLSHTGDWAFLSPLPASGVLVYTISGTTASGTYHFRTAYS